MSLIKQLWLAVIAAMVLIFGGSLLLSVLTARDYLQQQLQVKNIDNATALALSLSQLPKDRVTVELQVAAQFDAGHYQFIRIHSPSGAVLVERVYSGPADPTPAWFVRWVPIRVTPGQAQIQDGWKQYGTLTLESHGQYAYQSLWRGTLELLLWFAWAGTLVGVLGAIGLRRMLQPLTQVVGQAKAIATRRFVQLAEPRTPELRSVVSAMNSLVVRLQAMFSEEAGRLEALRQSVNHDALTGLSVRAHFLSHLHQRLSGDEFGSQGTLVIVRLQDLASLNAELGHERTDRLLQELGALLQLSCQEQPGRQAGRLMGGEFALLCPAIASPVQVAREMHTRLGQGWLPYWSHLVTHLFHLAAVPYRRGQTVSDLLSHADGALARAALEGANSWDAHDDEASRVSHSAQQWRQLLTQALAGQQLRLAYARVISCRSQLDLHHQGALRLHLEGAGAPLASGDFMPMAAQLHLAAAIDLQATKLALLRLGHTSVDVAINLSAEAIADFNFRHQFTQLLQAQPTLSQRLLLGVSESGVIKQPDAFYDLVQTLKPLGCRIGIDYFSQRFAIDRQFASLGLDYIQIHPSYIHGLAQSPGNQEFLSGLCKVAHHFGIVVIARGVATDGELPLLAELGFDGATRAGVE